VDRSFRALSLLLLLAAGCAPAESYRVEVLEPGFDGTRTWRGAGNRLAARGSTAAPLELNLERVERLRQPAQSFLLVEYGGVDWLRIRDAESLLLRADADSVLLSPQGAAERQVLRGTQPVERRRYPVTAEQLRRVADAQAVQVVVRGATRSESRFFSPENFERLRAFLREHPDTAAVAPAPADTTRRDTLR